MITLDERIPDRRTQVSLDHLELQQLNFRRGRRQLKLRSRPIGLWQVGAGSAPNLGKTDVANRRRHFSSACRMLDGDRK